MVKRIHPITISERGRHRQMNILRWMVRFYGIDHVLQMVQLAHKDVQPKFKPGSPRLRPDALVADLELSVRTLNVLKREGIVTLQDLYDVPMDKWVQWQGFGPRSQRELAGMVFHE